MKPSVHTYKSIVAPVLGFVAAIFFLAALPQTVTAQSTSPCLVYNSRSSSSTTGYSSSASGGTGIMVLGPQFTEATEQWTDSEQGSVQATKREVQEYYISGSKTQKSYSKVVTSDESGPNNKRVVGFFNIAPKNSPKQSLFFAVMPWDYTVPTFSENERSIIGKASEQSPYPGAPKILMATAMQSSSRFYDLNADYVWDGNGTPPKQKNLGQDGTTRRAALISDKTTYSHNPQLSGLVKNKNFYEACAAIEKWLQDNGYVDLDAMN